MTLDARRAAAHREPGEPYLLVVLFRAPPPVHVAADKMWIDPAARPRNVTVVARRAGGTIYVFEMIAVQRRAGWTAYVDRVGDVLTGLWTTGPLDPRDRGILWCWGHRGKNVAALRVIEALR